MPCIVCNRRSTPCKHCGKQLCDGHMSQHQAKLKREGA